MSKPVPYHPSHSWTHAYRWVQVGKDSQDKMLSGRKGWIFEAGPGRLGVVTVRRDRSENLSYCNYKEFWKQIQAISVLRDMEQACYYANTPNARHEK